MTSAVVFVLSQHLLPDVDLCINHALARGYRVVCIVKDNWQQAIDYLNDGTAAVLIVASRGRLDPDRTPRIESAEDGGGPGPAGHSRPQLIG